MIYHSGFRHAGRFAGERDVPMHVHEGCELIHITSGLALIDCDENTFAVATGHLVVVPAGFRHNQRHTAPAATDFVTFQAKPLFNTRPRVVDIRANSLTGQWLNSICILSERDPHHCHELAEGVLDSLLGAIAQQEQPRSRALPEPLQRALDFVESPEGLATTVGELARVACVSEGYLMGLFRKHLGQRPTQYLNSLRIDKAKRMLCLPYTTIGETALACGFSDPNYFARVFSAITGSSPRAYQRRLLD